MIGISGVRVSSSTSTVLDTVFGLPAKSNTAPDGNDMELEPDASVASIVYCDGVICTRLDTDAPDNAKSSSVRPVMSSLNVTSSV